MSAFITRLTDLSIANLRLSKKWNMKKLLFIVIVTASSLVVTQRGTAAETAQKPAKPDVKAELEGLVGKIQAKLKDGKRTEAELASELKSRPMHLTLVDLLSRNPWGCSKRRNHNHWWLQESSA